MDVRVGLWRNLSTEELMLLNCGYGWVIFHCVCVCVCVCVSHIFFILSSVDGHWGFFHTLTIVNSYATLLNTNFYSNIDKKKLASIYLSLLPYFSICSEFQQRCLDPSNPTFTPGALKHSPVTSSLKKSHVDALPRKMSSLKPIYGLKHHLKHP